MISLEGVTLSLEIFYALEIEDREGGGVFCPVWHSVILSYYNSLTNSLTNKFEFKVLEV